MSPAFALATAVLGVTLMALTVTDLRQLRLPDVLTLPLLAAGLAFHGVAMQGVPWPYLAGAALGYGVFAALGAAFYRLRGIDGLGRGDAKLLAAGGAWTGVSALPFIVLAAALGALALALVTRKGRQGQIAFGPWLAAAIFLAWLLRDCL